MDKANHPESFGVFNPVGHTVIALRSPDALDAAAQALVERGFAAADLTRYTPEEMVTQVDADLHSASPLASLGQDLNMVRAHRALALVGCSFLVVNAPDDEQARQVAALATEVGAVSAQRYGRFVVEELIAAPPGDSQVFESPARGLDVRVRGELPR